MIKTAVFLLCFCTLNVFSQTAQQPTREDLVAAGSIHGRRYVNTAVGLTYDLPKSVEVDSKFAAMASRDAVLAALDRKWKQGSHQNMVLLSVGASEVSPEQQVTSKAAPLQQQPGFRWIEQPHEARVGMSAAGLQHGNSTLLLRCSRLAGADSCWFGALEQPMKSP
jgi:hypothetical protein